MGWLKKWMGGGASGAELEGAREEARVGVERLRNLRADLGEGLAPPEADAERRLAALDRDLGDGGEATAERRAKVLAGYERLREDCRELRKELLAANPALCNLVLLSWAEEALADVPLAPERAAVLIELSGFYAAFGQPVPAEECLGELELDGPEDVEAAFRALEPFLLLGTQLPREWLDGVQTRLLAAIGRNEDGRWRLDARCEAARVLAVLHRAVPAELFEGIDDAWHADHARAVAAERLAQILRTEEARALAEEVADLELRARVDRALVAAEAEAALFAARGEAGSGERAGETEDEEPAGLDDPARAFAQVERLCGEGRVEEAAAIAAQVEDPDWRTDLWGEVAVAAAGAGDLERARDALAEVGEPHDVARVLERMAAERRGKGDEEGARALYLEAAEAHGSLVQPGSDVTLAPLAYALNLAGEHARAVSLAERIEAKGTRTELFGRLGWGLARGPGFESVEELLAEISNPTDRAQAALGGVWGLLGRPLAGGEEGEEP